MFASGMGVRQFATRMVFIRSAKVARSAEVVPGTPSTDVLLGADPVAPVIMPGQACTCLARVARCWATTWTRLTGAVDDFGATCPLFGVAFGAAFVTAFFTTAFGAGIDAATAFAVGVAVATAAGKTNAVAAGEASVPSDAAAPVNGMRTTSAAAETVAMIAETFTVYTPV